MLHLAILHWQLHKYKPQLIITNTVIIIIITHNNAYINNIYIAQYMHTKTKMNVCSLLQLLLVPKNL